MFEFLFLTFAVGMFLFFPLYINSKVQDIKNKIKDTVNGLANNSLELTPDEFFSMRNTTLGGRGNPKIASQLDFEGVYILFNKSKDMYYIGQGKKVFVRVNSHFTGKGNGDVYADYKYGDIFTIKMISLDISGYGTLNELERNAILTYDAYAKGYNKTRGNRN